MNRFRREHEYRRSQHERRSVGAGAAELSRVWTSDLGPTAITTRNFLLLEHALCFLLSFC